MHRKYRPRHYEDRILKARAWMPDAAIGADVMTGFPGETDAEFEETRTFIERLPFTYLHVFTYSERAGTPAATSQQIPMEVRRDRNRILRELAARKNLEFRRGMIGRTVSVITLTDGALSDNFLKVELATPRDSNQLIDVKIGSVNSTGLREHTALTVL
jgi:threonylcarbamoyladenosine tRNA methylthiotransferase MtaB